MKYKIYIQTLILLISSLSSLAQDTIVFRTGEKQEASIKKVGVDIIEYIRYDNQNGPIYETEKSQVLMIKYANGTSDNFASYSEKRDKKSTLNTFTDERDGQVYRFIVIGDQKWMVDNLKYDNGHSPCYDSKDENCEFCGRYYTFDEAIDVCPKGWHLPTDEEWSDLEFEVGMSKAETLKNGWRGTAGGQSGHLLEKGSSGLDLLFCGYMMQINFSKKKPRYAYDEKDKSAYYWTASQFNDEFAYYRKLTGRRSINRSYERKSKRYPVRCLKD